MIPLKIRKDMMALLVESKLPELRKAVDEALKSKAEVVILHQDAFCADYQEFEFYLLGNAIKYIGEFGLEIRIIGKNRETLNETTNS
jgi:hypothetical protein